MTSFSLSLRTQTDCFLNSSFLQPFHRPGYSLVTFQEAKKISFSISCSYPKVVRDVSLDRHAVKQNRTRFVQKLKTLLLSKPKHYISIHILSKCRSYLSLTDNRSIVSMIHRYPSIFELFRIPTPPTPLNATKSCTQLCVRLTPAAEALATQEFKLQAAISVNLANKLQKLLMLSSHRRLLLSKLVHLAPDLGLPPNFRSRICNDYPDKFKTVDTSYGRALELVSWNEELAVPLSRCNYSTVGLIVDRPLKFKQLKLRKGLNVKRRHRDYLIKFGELPDVCPYSTCIEEFAKASIEAEKRACALVREVLAMTVEKRTLVDHLTHFRKEFGLPNKLRGMIMRHPELFYVSLKGLRDSVFLIEGFDEKGILLEKDETWVMKEQWMELVREARRMRRDRRRRGVTGYNNNIRELESDADVNDEFDDDYDDGFENVFENDDSDLDFDFVDETNFCSEFVGHVENGEFWTADASYVGTSKDPEGTAEPW